MTKCIQTTGETGHIIDDLVLMKTYNVIVLDVYHRTKFQDLPAVQSHETLLSSKGLLEDGRGRGAHHDGDTGGRS